MTELPSPRPAIAYFRVSTDRQAKSGLGLAAQRTAVAAWLAATGHELVAEFREIESGAHDQRPELGRALALCQLRGAVLIIAKLDRLSRDAHFLLGLQKAGIDFVCADMPAANRLTVGIMAMVAEEERSLISRRTSEALAAAKAKGVKLGTDNLTDAIRATGRAAALRARRHRQIHRARLVAAAIAQLEEFDRRTTGAIARALNAIGIPAPRGGAWGATQVRRVLAITSPA